MLWGPSTYYVITYRGRGGLRSEYGNFCLYSVKTYGDFTIQFPKTLNIKGGGVGHGSFK